MHAANRALLLCKRLINLGNGLVPANHGKFLGAEEPRKEATVIAQLLSFNDLEIGDGGIEDGEAAHDVRLDSLVIS